MSKQDEKKHKRRKVALRPIVVCICDRCGAITLYDKCMCDNVHTRPMNDYEVR